MQNFPNPCTGTTEISYTLKQTGRVWFYLYDITGKLQILMDQGILYAGEHGLNLNLENLDAGIYFYTVFANDRKSPNRKLVLVK